MEHERKRGETFDGLISTPFHPVPLFLYKFQVTGGGGIWCPLPL